MIIAGIQKVTLIDYPGKIGATVFLSGCNFRCDWCYSAELVLPEKIKNQPIIPEKEFFSFLRQRQGLLEGIVICGGEPTINKDLARFIKKIKKLGFLVKLDTNGSNPKMLKELINNNLLDYVAMDIKLPQERYAEVFANVKNIENSVKILKEGKIDSEFRTTMVPSILKKKDILEITKWIGGPKVKYYLQNFRSEKNIDPQFEKVKPYSDKYMLEIQHAISPFFAVCKIR